MKDGEPWFVATDVCKVLGIANVTLAVRRLDADEKDLHQLRDTAPALYSIKASAYAPTVNIVNEPGLYALVAQSRKPEAKRFDRWVRHTVLPAIRKDGGYIQGEERVATGEMDEEALIARAEVHCGAFVTSSRD